jgi:hypothetical protein
MNLDVGCRSKILKVKNLLAKYCRITSCEFPRPSLWEIVIEIGSLKILRTGQLPPKTPYGSPQNIVKEVLTRKILESKNLARSSFWPDLVPV